MTSDFGILSWILACRLISTAQSCARVWNWRCCPITYLAPAICFLLAGTCSGARVIHHVLSTFPPRRNANPKRATAEKAVARTGTNAVPMIYRRVNVSTSLAGLI
jgi:hypothetical protein